MKSPDIEWTVGKSPFRKGFWLHRREGSVTEHIAKFRTEDAMHKFVAECRALEKGLPGNGENV